MLPSFNNNLSGSFPPPPPPPPSSPPPPPSPTLASYLPRFLSSQTPESLNRYLRPVFQRVPGIWLLLLVPCCLLACVYAPIPFSFYFTFASFVSMYQTWRSLCGIYNAHKGVRVHATTDWRQRYCEVAGTASLGDDLRHDLPFDMVDHIIILPNYKEEMDTLCETLDVLASHSMALTQYKICLAMEETEVGCRQKAETLCKLYSDSFFSIVYTIHPQNIPGEIRGKSSNVAWAARQMANLDQCESAPWDRTYQKDSFASSSSSPSSTSGRSHEIVTVMDADTCFAEDYFTYVTFAYCTAIPEDRKIMMFAPCTIFDRNAKDVPLIVRATDICWSICVMSNLYAESGVKIPCSAYSLAMDLAVAVGFWDSGPEAMGEDMHMYLKCFFETGGRVIVKTVYSPASQCNVEGSGVGISGYVNAFQARYNQAKRHLWGSLDTGYILRRGFINLIAPLWADTVQISSSKSSSFNRDVVVDGAYRYDSPPSSSSSFTIVKKSTSTIASSASSSPLTFTVSKSSPWHREVTNQVPIDKLMSLYYRVLEAHIFVGHFFVLMFFVLPVVPLNGGLFDYPQFDSWFLNLVNAYIWPVYSGGMSVHPFMYRTMWLVGMVRSIWIPVCFILMFYFYQKYHRFIGFERWILQGEDFAVSSLTCNAHHAVFSHKYVSSENKDLRVHRLGKRPLLYSARNWFSFFDLSGAAFSGVLYMLMPMAHAQVSHLWCDKLDYKVAAKPVLNRSFSMEVTATHHSTISIISHNGNNNSIINNNNNINNNTNSMLLSPSHSVAAFLSVEEDMVTTSTRIVDGSSSPVSSTSPSAFAMDRAAALRIECASVGSISSINSDEGYYEEFDSSSELGASTSFSQKC